MLHAPAKVAYLQGVLVSYEQVLRLDISVDKPIFMKEIYSSYCLNEKVEGFVLSKLFFIADDEKQVTLRDVLEYQVYKFMVFERGVESHNVNVLELLLNMNLATKCLSHLN